jgi:hypothetical protein
MTDLNKEKGKVNLTTDDYFNMWQKKLNMMCIPSIRSGVVSLLYMWYVMFQYGFESASVGTWVFAAVITAWIAVAPSLSFKTSADKEVSLMRTWFYEERFISVSMLKAYALTALGYALPVAVLIRHTEEVYLLSTLVVGAIMAASVTMKAALAFRISADEFRENTQHKRLRTMSSDGFCRNVIR